MWGIALATKLRRFTSLANAIDMLVNNRLALLSPKTWQDRNDTRFLETFLESTGYKSVFAACFTRASETYHHWGVFGRANEGVCIEFNGEALLGPLDNRHGYYFRDVAYTRLSHLREMSEISVYDLPFMKRYGFKDEREFRLIYASKYANVSHYVDVDRSMVNRIIFNPWIPAANVDALKSVLRSIKGWRDIYLEKSSLIDNAQWEKACRKVDEFEFMLSDTPENQL